MGDRALRPVYGGARLAGRRSRKRRLAAAVPLRLAPFRRAGACRARGARGLQLPAAPTARAPVRSVDAIQIPAPTATTPMTRLMPIGSPIRIAARNAAASGLTVIVLATRVGVARSSAKTQR